MKVNPNEEGLVDPDLHDDDDDDEAERGRRMNTGHFLFGNARRRVYRYKRKKFKSRRGR